MWEGFCKLAGIWGKALSHLICAFVSSFLPVCKALCSFPHCAVDRNIWLFAIKAAMGVSVGLFLNVSIVQVQLQEKRPVFSLTHAGTKSEQLF